jgi:hypothetical protein
MGESISRGEVKSTLLRRSFWEQVPILRCAAHRDAKPTLANKSSDSIFRNLTASGLSYWSSGFWELEWTDVPAPCRWGLVVRGLRGPPFHRGTGPQNPKQLDLRMAYNACGERPWWWGGIYFDPGAKIKAPDLAALMTEDAAHSIDLGPQSYWIDGVIQLQGKLEPHRDVWKAFTMEAFPWRSAPIPVTRLMAGVNILLGCIWKDQEGAEVGALVWKYRDGVESRTPIVYGRDLRCFWQRRNDVETQPVPTFQSSLERDDKMRLYTMRCDNPRPAEPVASLAFESDRRSFAAPFILAVTAIPSE